MDTADVIREIEEAFKNVCLGSGIGLWEAQAIDDYETKMVQKKSRSKDEKEDWRSFKSEELQRCYSSLSFFDADGMRFHLPAYMVATLKGEEVVDPVFHLSHLSDYSKTQFTTLTSEQKSAVCLFLEWYCNQNDFEFVKPNIQRAINDFWRK